MALNNLLVAVDDSEGSRKAVDIAVDIATPNPDAHVDVAYVVNIPLLNESQSVNFKDILDMMMDDGKQLLEDVVAGMGDVADRAEALLLTGVSPATELVKLIEQRNYDLVIIGNRGLSGVQEYMGSVSHKVLHGSTVPVLIAK